MRYYIINNALDKKVVGRYPQVENAHYYCSIFDEPDFVDHHNFERTENDPIVAHPVLQKSARPTDLLSADIAGFHLRLLISGKFKEILQSFRKFGVQFYHTPLLTKDDVIEDYWVPNVFEINYHAIDIKKSKTVFRKRKPQGGTFLEQITFTSVDDFLEMINEQNLEGKLYLETIAFEDGFQEDFLALRYVDGGAKYIVSERLKIMIEEYACTGIEFQPTELSFNDWIKQGGERERIYGKV